MSVTFLQNDHLRNSREFQLVYNHGVKYEDELMAVFVRPNDLACHRLGITVSRKFSGRAVHRNRAKRILREAFRLNEPNLVGLECFYDWVLNAKRSLMGKKVHAPTNSFRSVVLRVRSNQVGS